LRLGFHVGDLFEGKLGDDWPDLGPRLHPMGAGHGLKLSPCLAMTCTLVGVERLDVPSGADVTII
jgi:hypothetical protein